MVESEQRLMVVGEVVEQDENRSGAPLHLNTVSVNLYHAGIPSLTSFFATMSADALQNNDKLFPVFKDNLADAKHFVDTAEKLRMWMSRDKAYYSLARPWVCFKSFRGPCFHSTPSHQF